MTHYLRREIAYMQNESQQEKFHTREPLTLRQFIEEPDTGRLRRGSAGYSGGGQQPHHQTNRGLYAQ